MSKYLVLRPFWSFGKMLNAGQVVDASEIRSPRIRQSEGKIIPAVSSTQVPVEFAEEEPTPQAPLGDDDKGAGQQPPETPEESSEESKKIRLRL